MSRIISACICCQQPYVGKPQLCPACYQLLRLTSHVTDQSLMVFSHDWDAFRCLGSYEALLAKLINQGKFAAEVLLLKHLGYLFSSVMLAHLVLPPGAVIPVPMKYSRRVKRGFNQSEVVARSIAEDLSMAVDSRLVRHSGHGRVQHQLNKRERQKNMRHAFVITGEVPRHVYIVDDIYTTGATVRAMCQTLKAAGAEYIEVWVLAKTP